MKCASCGKILNNTIVAFCEKCEKYYCMNCTAKHNHSEFALKRLENGILTKINTGIRGAGIGDTHPKFYTDEKRVLRRRQCEHAKQDMELGKVIFYCADGKIRCSKCFYESKQDNADPIMKNNENKLMYLLTRTYEPQNLEFAFDCDDEGMKGEEITLHITIKNNKLHDIEDINLAVEAFAAQPLPENTSINMYREEMRSKYLILKTITIDRINAETTFKKDLKVRIPEDGEINKNQFVNSTINAKIENADDNKLNVPNELMIYAQFTYKTCTGFKYWSYVESEIVKLK